MEKLIIEIPEKISREIAPYRDKLPELVLLGLQQLKIQEALLLYARGLISFGRAAELAGLHEAEFIRQARAAGIQPSWAKEMLEEELA